MKKRNKISFTCPNELLKQIDEIAKREGITRSALIVELIELGLRIYDPTMTMKPTRDIGTEKLILMFQERLEEIEHWRDEVENWKKRIEPEIKNHETVIMELLNAEITEIPAQKKAKSRTPPKPRK